MERRGLLQGVGAESRGRKWSALSAWVCLHVGRCGGGGGRWGGSGGAAWIHSQQSLRHNRRHVLWMNFSNWTHIFFWWLMDETGCRHVIFNHPALLLLLPALATLCYLNCCRHFSLFLGFFLSFYFLCAEFFVLKLKFTTQFSVGFFFWHSFWFIFFFISFFSFDAECLNIWNAALIKKCILLKENRDHFAYRMTKWFRHAQILINCALLL